MPTEQITPEHASTSGLRPLTTMLHPEKERWIADRVLSDLRRSNIRHALVVLSDGRIEVWRDRAGWKE